MKFYQAEMDAFEFMKVPHTLKEWAQYGFNQVKYNNESYCDGCHSNGAPITPQENEEAGMLIWSYRDFDEDGYIYLILEKVKGA